MQQRQREVQDLLQIEDLRLLTNSKSMTYGKHMSSAESSLPPRLSKAIGCDDSAKVLGVSWRLLYTLPICIRPGDVDQCDDK